MSVRKLPVRPDLTQLKHQAKDLHRAIPLRVAHPVDRFVNASGDGDPCFAHLIGQYDSASARLHEQLSNPHRFVIA